MGPSELNSLQLAGAQKLVDARSTDIEQLGGSFDRYGQAIVEVDWTIVAFAHGGKNMRKLAA